jgi:hypothetical protein
MKKQPMGVIVITITHIFYLWGVLISKCCFAKIGWRKFYDETPSIFLKLRKISQTNMNIHRFIQGRKSGSRILGSRWIPWIPLDPVDPDGSQSRFIRRYQSSSKVIRSHKYPLSLLKPTKVHPFPPEFSKAYCFLMKEDNLDPNGSWWILMNANRL